MDAPPASHNDGSRTSALRRQLNRERVVFGSLLLLASLLLYQALLAQRVTAIALDGVEVVYVADRRTAEQVLAELRQELGSAEGLGVRFAQRIATYSALRRGQPLSLPDQAKQILTRRLTVLVPAYAVRQLDGAPLVWALTRQAVVAALQEVKDALSGRVGALVEEPKVAVTLDDRFQYVPIAQVAATAEEIADLLLGRRTGAKEHVVKRGEVALVIAKRHGLTLDQLKAMNPGKNLARLHPGDRLTIKQEVIEPKVVVESVEKKEEEEQIPPPVEEVVRPELQPGEKRLVQEGMPGRRKVIVHWRCRNGRPIARQVVDTKILRPPKSARVEVGVRE